MSAEHQTSSDARFSSSEIRVLGSLIEKQATSPETYPLACSLFGIPSEIAMQVVAVGFIIGVLQDSAETALNSSTDVLFTAAACLAEERQAA